MALTETSGASTPPVTRRAESAPNWIFPLYVAGLVLVYVGERVLSGLPRGAGFVTVVGLLAALAATVLRFSPRFRAGGERRSIETLLAVLSAIGLVGLVLYFLTGEFGAGFLGLDNLTTERRARVEELSRVVWVALIVISLIPQLFAETALRPMRNAERPESRRVRSAATAGLALALAAVYGSLAVYAASGVDLNVDYSYFKTSQPSESTRKLAQSLSGDPIRVIAFFPDVNEVRREVESYLKQLASSSPKLKVEIKDRLLEPKLAQELRVMQDGAIVLSRGSMTQSLQLGTELDQARPKLKTLDRDFQEQLLKIARSKHTAYLTVGHGELNDAQRGRSDAPGRTAQIIRTLLQKQNYTLRDLGMAQGLANDVPEDADVVLVLGPSTSFSGEELASLRRYAARGGKLILALDPDAIAERDLVTATPQGDAPKGSAAAVDGLSPQGQPRPPGSAGPAAAAIPTGSAVPAGSAAPGAAPAFVPRPASEGLNEDLAKLAGLRFSADLLANERQHVRVRYNDSDRTRLVTNSFSSHASVSTLSRNQPRAAVIVFGAGSLEKAEGAPETIDFTVRSMGGTFQDRNKNFAQDMPGEKTSVYNIGAAASRSVAKAEAPKKDDPKDPVDKKDAKDKKEQKPEKVEQPPEFRAFVLADADAISDFVMGEVIGNQVLFVDAVRWLVGEESVQGLPNTEEDVRMEHTKQGDLGWFYGSIFGAPCLVLGAGLLISRRSRAQRGKR